MLCRDLSRGVVPHLGADFTKPFWPKFTDKKSLTFANIGFRGLFVTFK
jgi:hypothetical protein